MAIENNKHQDMVDELRYLELFDLHGVQNSESKFKGQMTMPIACEIAIRYINLNVESTIRKVRRDILTEIRIGNLEISKPSSNTWNNGYNDCVNKVLSLPILSPKMTDAEKGIASEIQDALNDEECDCECHFIDTTGCKCKCNKNDDEE